MRPFTFPEFCAALAITNRPARASRRPPVRKPAPRPPRKG
jgi:hypothetical protein